RGLVIYNQFSRKRQDNSARDSCSHHDTRRAKAGSYHPKVKLSGVWCIGFTVTVITNLASVSAGIPPTSGSNIVSVSTDNFATSESSSRSTKNGVSLGLGGMYLDPKSET